MASPQVFLQGWQINMDTRDLVMVEFLEHA